MIPKVEIIEDDKKNARIRYIDSKRVSTVRNLQLIQDHERGILNVLNKDALSRLKSKYES